MEELLKDLKLPNLETLYQNLGNGNTGINSISNRINKLVFPGEISVDEDLYSPEIKEDSKSDLVIVEGYDDIKVRMGKCCVPVPGDDILGFVTISNGAGRSSENGILIGDYKFKKPKDSKIQRQGIMKTAQLEKNNDKQAF